MAFQRKLTPKQERALIVDYEDGWKVGELSVIYRISVRTVYRLLAEHNAPRQKVRRKKRKPRSKPKRELKPCGTDAAYRRHKSKGEYPCTPCLAAHAKDVADRKKAKANGARNKVPSRT